MEVILLLRAFGKVWRHVGLSLLGGGGCCCWMPLSVFQCIGQTPQQGIVPLKTSVVPGLRIPDWAPGVRERVHVCFLFYVWKRKCTQTALVITVADTRLCPGPGIAYGNSQSKAGLWRTFRAHRKERLFIGSIKLSLLLFWVFLFEKYSPAQKKIKIPLPFYFVLEMGIVKKWKSPALQGVTPSNSLICL